MAAHRWRASIALLALVMSACLLVLFVVGALGVFIVPDVGIGKAQLGLLVTIAFAVATVTSVVAGLVLDYVGVRQCLVLTLAIVALSLGLLAVAPGYSSMLAAAAMAGFALAFANPVTNKLIVALVPRHRHGLAMGIKQSGVPFAGLVAGTPLSAVASSFGWRVALWVAAGSVSLLLAISALVIPRTAESHKGPSEPLRLRALSTFVRLLMGYSFCIGGGVAALNTYLALYAHERLALSQAAAANLVAAVGVTGVISRIGWAVRADRGGSLPRTLKWLGLGGTFAAVLLAGAVWVGRPALWVGAIGLGLFGVAANAVSMLAVVKKTPPAQVGHASALVSLGFFAGFIVSPIVVGLLVDGGQGYPAGWAFVATQFAVAAYCGTRLEALDPRQASATAPVTVMN